MQADAFNRSRIRTVIGVALSSNTALLDAPGNVLVPAKHSGLPRDSVANVSQIVTIDREFLTNKVGKLPPRLMAQIDAGVCLVLDL